MIYKSTSDWPTNEGKAHLKLSFLELMFEIALTHIHISLWRGQKLIMRGQKLDFRRWI